MRTAQERGSRRARVTADTSRQSRTANRLDRKPTLLRFALDSSNVQLRLKSLLSESEKSKREARDAAGKPCIIMYPDDRTVTVRNMMGLIALIITFIVVPFEVAFIDAPPVPDPTDHLWILNRCIDVIFVYDIALEFFVAYQKPSSILTEAQQSAEDDDGLREIVTQLGPSVYEFRLSRIFCNYLRGWLLLDLMSMGPSAFEVYMMVVSNESGSNEANIVARSAKTTKIVKFVRAARVLRLLRLLKLLKLLRAIKLLNDPDGLYQRFVDYVSLKFIAHGRKLSVVKLCLIFLVLAHVQACLLGLSALLAEQRAHTWWGRLGYCFPEQAELPDNTCGEGSCEEVIPCVEPLQQYWVCIAWALEFNFGIPSNILIMRGPGTPVFTNDFNSLFTIPENVIFTFCALAGALMGIYLQGRVVEVMTAPQSTAEQVNAFCKEYRVTRAIRHKLQTYFERLSKIHPMVPQGDLFSGLSPALAQETMLDIHNSWIRKLPFYVFLTSKRSTQFQRPRSAELRQHAGALMSKIALSMRVSLLVAKEKPTTGRMYVIINGVALETTSTRLITIGDNWGAVEAICGPAKYLQGWRSGERIEAQTFCQVVYIDYKMLAEIVRMAPELADAYLKMRVWGFHKRLLRSIKLAASIERMKLRDGGKQMLRGGAGKGGSPPKALATAGSVTDSATTHGSDSAPNSSYAEDRAAATTAAPIREANVDAKLAQLRRLVIELREELAPRDLAGLLAGLVCDVLGEAVPVKAQTGEVRASDVEA